MSNTHIQKILKIERNDSSFVEVTDYIDGLLRLDHGDVSGVGDQGNDGITPSLSFRLKNTEDVNYNPEQYYGQIKYYQEIISGDGTDTYTLQKSNILCNSVTIVTTLGFGKTWSDLGIMTWNDLGTMTWNDLVTSDPFSERFDEIILNSNGTITFSEGAIPSGLLITIQYRYFDETAINTINWTSDLTQQESLIESGKRAFLQVRKGERVYEQDTIVGNGTNEYAITLPGGVSIGQLIPYSATMFEIATGYFFTEVEIDFVNSKWIFSESVPNTVSVTIQYSYNDGDLKTRFIGILGDSIKSSVRGVEVFCRDQRKILQDINLVPNFQVNETVIEGKIRPYQNGNDTDSVSPIGLYSSIRVAKSVTLVAGGASITGTGIDSFFSINDYATIYNSTTKEQQLRKVTGTSSNTLTFTDVFTITAGTYDLYFAYDSGVPIKDYIQNLLDDTLGASAPTVVENTAANYNIIANNDHFEYLTVDKFCQDRVNEIGWFFGYRYNSISDDYDLEIYEPDRSKTTPDRSLSFVDEIRIQELTKSDQDFRDGVVVFYFNESNNADDLEVYPGSDISVFNKPLFIEKNNTKGISNSSEAARLAEAIYEDVKNVPQRSQIIVPLAPEIELFELVEITYLYLYYQSQNFAVESISEDYITETTTFIGANRVRGGVKLRKKQETRPGAYIPNVANTITTVYQIQAPENLTLETTSLENNEQIITIRTEASWTRPVGYAPIQYQIEYKKSTDGWDKAIKQRLQDTNVKLSLEDQLEYNVRVAGVSKEGRVGIFSEIKTIDTGDFYSDSQTVYIRNQTQLDRWFNSLSISSGSPTNPLYSQIKIFKNSVNYELGSSGTPITNTKYIDTDVFEIIGIGKPIIEVYYAYTGTSQEQVFDITFDDFKISNIKFETYNASTTTGLQIFFVLREKTLGTLGESIIKNIEANENTHTGNRSVCIAFLGNFQDTKLNILGNVIKNYENVIRMQLAKSNTQQIVIKDNEFVTDSSFKTSFGSLSFGGTATPAITLSLFTIDNNKFDNVRILSALLDTKFLNIHITNNDFKNDIQMTEYINSLNTSQHYGMILTGNIINNNEIVVGAPYNVNFFTSSAAVNYSNITNNVFYKTGTNPTFNVWLSNVGTGVNLTPNTNN